MEPIVRTTTQMPTARSEMSAKALADELDKEKEFQEVLRKFDAMQETAEERRTREAREAKEAQQKKEKNKKIAELRGLIAQLKSKMMSSGHDPKVAAELSAAENQLFWLMFSLG